MVSPEAEDYCSAGHGMCRCTSTGRGKTNLLILNSGTVRMVPDSPHWPWMLKFHWDGAHGRACPNPELLANLFGCSRVSPERSQGGAPWRLPPGQSHDRAGGYG